MKTAIVMALFPLTLPASDNDRPATFEQVQSPVAAVQEAMRKLKRGMEKADVMRRFPSGSLQFSSRVRSVPPITIYKVGQDHTLSLEFDLQDRLIEADLREPRGRPVENTGK